MENTNSAQGAKRTSLFEKPKLSFWQIWNMSFGFLGIQFGFGLQNANVSRIFETLGAKVDDIPILWIFAPIAGLLVQPIIGYMSDHTWGRLGRRRLYFLIGAILSSFALFVFPFASVLWFAAACLLILDMSINISMEPFRALVGDMLPSSQRTSGFAMQSFFIGIGAVVASALPYILTRWFGISNIPAGPGQIPPSVSISFFLGAIVFISAVSWTVFKTQEYPPAEFKKFHPELSDTKEPKLGIVEIFTQIFTMPKTMAQLAVVQFFTWFALFSMWIYTTTAVTSTQYNMKIDKTIFTTMQSNIQDSLARSPKTVSVKGKEEFKSLKADILLAKDKDGKMNIPLSLAQHYIDKKDSSLFSKEDRKELHRVKAQYSEGADWVGVCFAVYNGLAAIFAFFIPWMARRTSRKTAHMICLAVGGLGLISISIVRDPNFLILSMICIGLAWSSILSMPYAILAGALPAKKMGMFMGMFNYFIVIPQILAASVLGFITAHFFHSEAVYTLVFGGCSMIFAGLMTLFVKDVDEKR